MFRDYKDYKLLLNYYLKSWKFILISTLMLTFIGFFNAITETPLYEVSIVVAPNEEGESTMAGSGLSSVQQVLGVGKTGQSSFVIFRETFYSIDATEALNNRENTLFKIYGHLYDEKDNNYKEIVDLKTTLQKIKWRFYGIDFEKRPNVYMLNRFIKGSIKTEMGFDTDFVTISSLTGNPELIQSIIQSLLLTTDESFKKRDKISIDAKIEYLYGELKKTQDNVLINSVTRILQSQLLKRSLIDSGARYKFKIVRGFETSEYPVYPNFMFLIVLFSAFGFFIALAYKTYYFIFRISKS